MSIIEQFGEYKDHKVTKLFISAVARQRTPRMPDHDPEGWTRDYCNALNNYSTEVLIEAADLAIRNDRNRAFPTIPEAIDLCKQVSGVSAAAKEYVEKYEKKDLSESYSRRVDALKKLQSDEGRRAASLGLAGYLYEHYRKNPNMHVSEDHWLKWFVDRDETTAIYDKSINNNPRNARELELHAAAMGLIQTHSIRAMKFIRVAYGQLDPERVFKQ